MRLGPTGGEELEEWLKSRADDLEMYRESHSGIEWKNTVERIEKTCEKVLENED